MRSIIFLAWMIVCAVSGQAQDKPPLTPPAELESVLRGHQRWVTSVAYSPDGRLIASGSDDQTLRIWDAATKELRHTLQPDDNATSAVAFHPAGKLVAAGSWDGTFRIWNLADETIVLSERGHRETITSLAFSPDGKQLATGSSGDELLTIEQGNE